MNTQPLFLSFRIAIMHFLFRRCKAKILLTVVIIVPVLGTAADDASGALINAKLHSISLPFSHAVVDTTEHARINIDLSEQSDADSLYVVVDDNFDSPRYIRNRDNITLPEGKQRLTLATKNTRDFSTTMTVESGEIDTLRVQLARESDRSTYLRHSSYPVLHRGVNVAVETDYDTEVYIDGTYYGEGYVEANIPAGRYLVEAVHPEAGKSAHRLVISGDMPRLSEIDAHVKPSRTRVKYSSFMPGVAQLYKNENWKGLGLMSSFVAFTTGALQQHTTFRNTQTEYDTIRDQYEGASTERRALQLGNEAEHLYDRAQTIRWRRNIFIGAAVGVYLYSLFDGRIHTPDGGYRTPLARGGTQRIQPLLLGDGGYGVRLVLGL